MISISGDSMVPLLEHDDTVMLDCSQTRPSPPGIFILDDGVGLVAKRIEIISSPNR
jgi:phage repressor protein C with HTH and peptisase S24 domain